MSDDGQHRFDSGHRRNPRDGGSTPSGGTKYCSKCELDKPVDEFSLHKKRGRQVYCKACQKAYADQYYAGNKKRFRQYNEKYMAKIRAFIKRRKKECEICGESHPAVLEFHHIDPAKKEINISVAAKHGWSIERLSGELAKCQILCANCHRKKHWRG